MIFLSIQKYLYDRLTDDKMINHIRNKIHLLDFKDCQKLVEITPGLEKKRNNCKKQIIRFNEALKKINKLKTNSSFLEEDEEKIEEEEEEENQDEIDKNKEEKK
jgi:peroxiredoxin